MDEKDEIVLKTLLRNSRTPLTHIALKIGLTEAAVRKRINKLERVGAIRAYTAIIDPYYIGYEGVALVGIDTTPEKVLDVFEQIKVRDDIRYAALTSGDHMIIFEIWCKKPEDLNAVLKEMGRMDGVTRICPAVFLRRME
ncbi:Lrp/AsnC family transcriptional regulator [Candidatus Micrarchaeota archaeon]|nr:Lrp/AsnC family transcriptional regulator [Candidatus Micrarchaeota archaeon]MBU1165433.1 Lrp/AsnC family transcriptional regulator [Candidatus Micrarchaeota archaeon]MBU1887217.1 Lrp/AsnC family transcriptional regulator [Candidatus Micrarchaeota archaeon]